MLGGGDAEGKKSQEEDEVTSPLKVQEKKQAQGGGAKKGLFLEGGRMEEKGGKEVGERVGVLPAPEPVRQVEEKEMGVEVNSAMHVDEGPVEVLNNMQNKIESSKEKTGRGGKFKRVMKDTPRQGMGAASPLVGRKRTSTEGEVDGMNEKKLKVVGPSFSEAGLPEQSCENQ